MRKDGGLSYGLSRIAPMVATIAVQPTAKGWQLSNRLVSSRPLAGAQFMPTIKIVPADQHLPTMVITAADATAALESIGKMPCADVDVFANDKYVFSLRTEDRGRVWTVFERYPDTEAYTEFQ